MTVKTVIFVLLFTETSFIYPIFVHVLFRVLYPEKRMKRESGESPEQSRCCEFHARCIILVPLFFGKNGKAMYRERVRRPDKTKSKNCPFEESGQCANGLKIIFIYLCQEGLRYYWSVLFHWVQVYSGSLPREVGGDTDYGESASDRESDSDSTQVAQ